MCSLRNWWLGPTGALVSVTAAEMCWFGCVCVCVCVCVWLCVCVAVCVCVCGCVSRVLRRHVQAGVTPLHAAARNGHLTTCSMLVKRGGDIHAITNVTAPWLPVTALISHHCCV